MTSNDCFRCNIIVLSINFVDIYVCTNDAKSVLDSQATQIIAKIIPRVSE